MGKKILQSKPLIVLHNLEEVAFVSLVTMSFMMFEIVTERKTHIPDTTNLACKHF